MGLKLGFMMHWAPGCQLGTYESWPLSDGDAAWSQEDFTWAPREECKQQYWDANKTFNPVKFDAASWAELAKECGFQYLLFTTKHHDGFCMYDTKTTDYKITSPDCPFHTHRDADIVGALYRGFRSRGMAISTYFSNPTGTARIIGLRSSARLPRATSIMTSTSTLSSGSNMYSLFMSRFGSCAASTEKLTCSGSTAAGSVRQPGQDIRLGEIVEEIRSTTQPHLIVCERTCGGEYENFITPEKLYRTPLCRFRGKPAPRSAKNSPSITQTPLRADGSWCICFWRLSAREETWLSTWLPSPTACCRSARCVPCGISARGSSCSETESMGRILSAPILKDRLFYTQKDNRVFCLLHL